MVFSDVVEQKMRYFTLRGKHRLRPCSAESYKSSLYGSRRKLDFILMYLKENPNQQYHAQLFGMSQAKVSEWVSFLTPLLELALGRMDVLPQSGYQCRLSSVNSDYILADVTERQVSKRVDKDGQKEEYSGKKKLHTIKNLALSSPEGYLYYMSPGFPGAVHDKAIWDQIQIEHPPINLLADLGFIGIDATHPNPLQKTA